MYKKGVKSSKTKKIKIENLRLVLKYLVSNYCYLDGVSMTKYQLLHTAEVLHIKRKTSTLVFIYKLNYKL